MLNAVANGLVITEDTLTPGLKAFPDKMNQSIGATVEYMSPRTESYAREKAPWTDQTGNARSTLHATPFHETGRHGIEIAHGVPYGIWLEVRWEGKYGIIPKTIKDMGKELMKTLRTLFSRMH